MTTSKAQLKTLLRNIDGKTIMYRCLMKDLITSLASEDIFKY